MARPPRFIPPRTMVEITARTVDGRCLLRPTPEFTDRVNGILGRALALHPVDLHSYTFMSNHLHMQATGPNAAVLSQFEAHVLGNTARVAQVSTGWKGRVWAGRCTPIPILDDLAAEQRLKYILANGTKEGLVESPLEWPGASSACSLADGCTRNGTFAIRRDGAVVARQVYAIRLTPLPAWASLAEEQRAARVVQMIGEIVEEARVARAGQPPAGRERVLSVDPFAPVALERSAPPICHTTDPTLWLGFKLARDSFVRNHAHASRAYRGEPPAEGFPSDAFLPSAFRRSPRE